MSFVATAVGITAGVASIGLGAASAAGAFTPSQPNLAADSAQMANLEASLLPEQNQLQAAAETGGTALDLNAGQQKTYNNLQRDLATAQANGNAADVTRIQNQIAQIQAKHGVNFAGNSTADIQSQLLSQAAQGQLANAKEFDPQYIAEAQAQEAQANPQGVAARQALYNDVQQQLNNPPTSPVANTMDSQIQERVAAGSGLTPEEQQVYQNSLNNSVLGTTGNTPDLSTALTTGFAGEQRQAGNDQSGAAWLASGETPSDIQYRSQQQDLSNLSSFINGQTPESQFSQLSGAATGPTPTTQPVPQQGANFNAPTQGANAGLTQFQEQTSAANPWTTGIAGVLGATNAAISAFTPIASPTI